jgi:alpha-glucosidase
MSDMKTLKNWTLQKQAAHHIELLVDGQHTLCLYVLEPTLFRVLLKRKGELALDRTWSIAPGQDVPWEGRHREDISGFSCPDWTLEQHDQQLVLATEALRVTVPAVVAGMALP